MTSYSLEFLPTALKQWNKLDNSVKIALHKKLKAVLSNPRTPKNKLREYKDLYKIKHRSSGYRLVYEINDTAILGSVVVIGRRNKQEVYNKLIYM